MTLIGATSDSNILGVETEAVFPAFARRGGCAIKKNGPLPLKAQTGWLVISRSLLIDAREALLIEWLQSVRCASICMDASRFYATTPSAPFKGGFAASLELGAFTPPCKGGEYASHFEAQAVSSCKGSVKYIDALREMWIQSETLPTNGERHH